MLKYLGYVTITSHHSRYNPNMIEQHSKIKNFPSITFKYWNGTFNSKIIINLELKHQLKFDKKSSKYSSYPQFFVGSKYLWRN